MASRFGVMNWAVVPLLRSRLRGVVGGRLAILTVIGRKSGQPHTFPTMIAVDDEGMVVVAGFAKQKNWWRNLLEEAPVTVEHEGKILEARARALVAEDAERGRALRRYLRRFGAMAKSIGASPAEADVDDATRGREAKDVVVVRITPIASSRAS